MQIWYFNIDDEHNDDDDDNDNNADDDYNFSVKHDKYFYLSFMVNKWHHVFEHLRSHNIAYSVHKHTHTIVLIQINTAMDT